MAKKRTDYDRAKVNVALDNAAKHYGCGREALVWKIDKAGAIHVKKKSAASHTKKKKQPEGISAFDCHKDKMRIFPGTTFRMAAEIVQGKRKKTRKSSALKIALISECIQADESGKITSKEIEAKTGICNSDVRALWQPIKAAKRDKPTGWKKNGRVDGVDESLICNMCKDTIAGSFECPECKAIIHNECETCHYTSYHKNIAVP